MTRTPPDRSHRAALAALLACVLLGAVASTGAVGATATPAASAAVAPSNVSVTDATLARSTVEAGEEAVVRATVRNDGAARETYPVELTANGRARVQTLVALDAGETRTLAFRQPFERPGTYDLAVNGVPAGTLTVTSAGGTNAEGTNVGSTAPTTATTGAVTAGPTAPGGTSVSLQAWVLLVLVVGALGAGGVYFARGRP